MNTQDQAKLVRTGAKALPGGRRRGQLHLVAILAALGGRYGWRWWTPVVVWGVVAIVGRLQAGDVSRFPIQTEAYESLTVASLAALLIIWIAGSRMAVSLGHHRGHVFGLASIVTMGLVAGLQLLAEVAERIEHAVVGNNGIRTMATSVPKAMEEGGDIVPSPLFDNVLHVFRTDLLYLTPIAAAFVVLVCWQLRWSWRGLLPGLLLVPVAFIANMLLAGTLQTLARGPRQDLALGLLGLGITVGVLLTLAWLAFRRAAV